MATRGSSRSVGDRLVFTEVQRSAGERVSKPPSGRLLGCRLRPKEEAQIKGAGPSPLFPCFLN